MKAKVFKSMMMFLLLVGVCLSTTSCSKDDDDDMMSQFSSLFSRTDYFIDMLDTIYDSYDAFGSKSKDSSDGKYTVTPMGRLIVVKKKASAGSVLYADIESALTNHYKTNSKVKDVYQNNGGTVTIDCRR